MSIGCDGFSIVYQQLHITYVLRELIVIGGSCVSLLRSRVRLLTCACRSLVLHISLNNLEHMHSSLVLTRELLWISTSDLLLQVQTAVLNHVDI